MTNTLQIGIKKKHNILNVIAVLSLVGLSIIFIFDSGSCIEYVKGGLRLCFFTVIPSLFPFLCIFGILQRCGAMEAFSSHISKPFCKIFALPAPALCAVLCGLCCGSPVGIKTACELYSEKKLTKKECERIICFCGCPSISFFISGIGVTLYGNIKVGILLYISVLLANLLCGVMLGLHEHKTFTNISTVKIEIIPQHFTNSIISATETIIRLCGFIVFFSTFINILSDFVVDKIPQVFIAVVLGVFEFVSGTNNAALTLSFIPSVILCAAITGWSGLSVHMQTIAIFGNNKISFKLYFLSKVIISLLSTSLAFLGLSFII